MLNLQIASVEPTPQFIVVRQKNMFSPLPPFPAEPETEEEEVGCEPLSHPDKSGCWLNVFF
jgi:hypothetical protein